ncbi:hypothetical protein F5X68DRAFT_56445 [Plectosphaerella plurivora]|uniref:Uncharacterized protein n=1 Tax=Plectosphaerella plurivora TaxID=936078 RepID=A0A9P9A5J3_9PEZI|nr:hypothetical protein F5X68DRAFT_56445 [Plectosphaerella plurivora]
MPPFTLETLSALPSRILPRQRTTDENLIVPTEYGALNPNLSSIAIAGIVLGSVGGFLLLLWFFYGCCAGIGPPVGYRTSNFGTSRVTVDRSYRSRSSRSRHHRPRRHSSGRPRVYATETTRVRETTTGGGPVIVEAEPVPMQERPRGASRAPPPPRMVDEESDSEDESEDEVVVIEERTPPRRDRRSSRYDERRRSRDY